MASKPIRRQSNRPDTTSLIMSVLVIGASAYVFARQGTDGVEQGLGITLRLIIDVGPEVLLGIGLAGMLQVALPAGLVSRRMGEGSGLTGIAVGLAAGFIAPGGPYVLFPIAASLMSSGAGIAPLSAFVAIRNSAAVNRLVVWEFPLLGIPFSLARIVCSVPVVAAQVVLTPVVFRMMPASARAAMSERFAEARANSRPGDS